MLISSQILATKTFALNLEERNHFALIKANKANVRSGPGTNYNIKFTYKAKGIPVKVIGKYDNWNEIEDFEGETGWISSSLISRKRNIIVKSKSNYINLYIAANDRSRILLKLENKVIAKLLGCKEQWCKIEVSNKKGWVKKTEIWGV